MAALNELASRGLVERTPDPADRRRRNIITITPAGAEYFQRLDGLLAGAQVELLAPLSRHERELLTHLLTQALDTTPAPEAARREVPGGAVLREAR